MRRQVRCRIATIAADSPADPGAAPDFAALGRAVEASGADSAIDAILLRGRGVFEFDGHDRDFAEADWWSAARAISECAAPVVAVIEGDAIGLGLELALACAARIARDGAILSFPGVQSGRLAIHGGSRRLPLLVGFPQAARMLVFGEAVGARDALRIGLLDGLSIDDIDLSAPRRANAWASDRRRPSGSEKIAAEAVLLGVSRRLKRERPGESVPLAALRAIEAAIHLSDREAASEAARLDGKLSRTEEAAALRHATCGAKALSIAFAGRGARIEDLAERAYWPLMREAVHLLDEGASPAQVDRCLTDFGFAEGPFARYDRLGAAACREAGVDAQWPRWRSYSPTLDLMVGAGRLGGPAAPGWRLPGGPDGSPPRSDPAIERLLESSAVSQRLTRRPLAWEVIGRRCLYAAMNGLAELAASAPELDAAGLDAIWTTRLDFPRWKGGPLFQGALAGIASVTSELEAWRRIRDTVGTPSAGLARLLAGLE